MKISLVALLLFLAGCPSEGGVTFSYALLRENQNVTFALSCAEAKVSRIRFMVGMDSNVDRLLQDDELEGRAIANCNQIDLNGDATLSPAEFGRFETPDDRLPAGDYDLFAVELAFEINGTVNTVQSRFPSASNYVDRWIFSSTTVGQPAVRIEEGKITTVGFSGYDGNLPELRLFTR